MNFDENQEVTVIVINIEIFRKYGPKSRFSQILTKIEIFRNFEQNQVSWKLWTNSFLLLTVDKIDNFDENRDFQKFWPKSGFPEHFDQIPEFSKILT